MDASAYLKRHGWRGAGHSLDVNGRGLSKPLLVSKKVDVLGVGLNKHAAVSDQWWMRAFDQGLQNFGTGKSSTLADVRNHGVNRGGLYGRFVKGESVPGTIGQDVPGKKEKSESADTSKYDAKVSGTGEHAAASKKKLSERKEKRGISRSADAFVAAAIKRGLIPKGPSDSAFKSDIDVEVVYGAVVVQSIFEKAGLKWSTNDDVSSSDSGRPDKLDRLKLKRRVKRAAKAYLQKSGVRDTTKSEAPASKKRKTGKRK